VRRAVALTTHKQNNSIFTSLVAPSIATLREVYLYLQIQISFFVTPHHDLSHFHLFHFYPQQFTSCSGLSVSHDILTWFVLL